MPFFSRRFYRFVLVSRRLDRLFLRHQVHPARSDRLERTDASLSRLVDGAHAGARGAHDGRSVGSLQNGTAFFASTSLIALGGAVTLFHSSGNILTIVAALPFGAAVTHVQWEMKVVGLMIIFIYFKFAWSYRLYNYVAIMTP